jgi:double-stranded uracil-DNA glycosylase
MMLASAVEPNLPPPSWKTEAARAVRERPSETRGQPLGPLRDVVVDHPRILFVGINPSLRSGELGHHFASPGNPFWRLLHAARLTPELLTPDQDQRLAEFGIALTNLCDRPTRSAADLSRAEIEQGCARLPRKCARMKPSLVAFVGVSLYGAFVRWRAREAKRTGHERSAAHSGQGPGGRAAPATPIALSGGPGAKEHRIGNARVFVVPNPSGLNASFPGFRHKLVWFEALREFAARWE